MPDETELEAGTKQHADELVGGERLDISRRPVVLVMFSLMFLYSGFFTFISINHIISLLINDISIFFKIHAYILGMMAFYPPLGITVAGFLVLIIAISIYVFVKGTVRLRKRVALWFFILFTPTIIQATIKVMTPAQPWDEALGGYTPVSPIFTVLGPLCVFVTFVLSVLWLRETILARRSRQPWQS